MKKLFLLLCLLPLFFVGCASNNFEGKERVTVKISNECNWAMSVIVRPKGAMRPEYNLSLGTASKQIELYADTDYVFLVKGVYDIDTKKVEIHIPEKVELMILYWDSYSNRYKFKGR